MLAGSSGGICIGPRGDPIWFMACGRLNPSADRDSLGKLGAPGDGYFSVCMIFRTRLSLSGTRNMLIFFGLAASPWAFVRALRAR